jgi:hypothetical protein
MLQVMLLPMLNALCFYVDAFQNLFAVANMAVFCNSLTSYLNNMTVTAKHIRQPEPSAAIAH